MRKTNKSLKPESMIERLHAAAILENKLKIAYDKGHIEHGIVQTMAKGIHNFIYYEINDNVKFALECWLKENGFDVVNNKEGLIIKW